MALRQKQTTLIQMLLAIILLVGWVDASQALSLLQVRTTSLSEGELLTLTFDQDLSLRITTSSGQWIELETTSPFFNDAIAPASQILSSIAVDDKTLRMSCNVPVVASLRRAGAGTWLLMMRPTGETAQPVRTSRSPEAQPQSNTDAPARSAEAETLEPVETEEQFSDTDLLMLAQLHKLQGRNDQAKETIDQISEDTDSYPWGRLLMGKIKEEEGDDPGAKEEYDTALKHTQTMSAAATSLALWHQRRGEKEEAETMWGMVLRSDDASVLPLAQGGGETGAFEKNAENAQPRAEPSGITFDGDSTPMQFFDTRILIIIVIALIVSGGIAGALLLHRSRNKSKEKPPVDAQEDEVFWGDENEEMVGDGQGSLDAELSGGAPDGDKPAKTREMKISEETRKMVVEMHNGGNSVREIAEITGKSQDEIRMALQMEGVTAEP